MTGQKLSSCIFKIQKVQSSDRYESSRHLPRSNWLWEKRKRLGWFLTSMPFLSGRRNIQNGGLKQASSSSSSLPVQIPRTRHCAKASGCPPPTIGRDFELNLLGLDGPI